MSTQVEIKNAVVEDVELRTDDHGLLSGWVYLKYECGGQGFGGYALYLPKSFKHHEMKSVAGHWIFRCMEVAGVERWSQMKGKTVRVRAEHHKVHAIGHIINEDWFEPAVDFDERAPCFEERAGGKDGKDL